MGTWTQAGEGIWVGIYGFNGNPVCTSIVDIGGGELMAISPGTTFEDGDFEELATLGTVTTLLAPGPFHNMGLSSWHKRYPEAKLYGSDASVKHIAKAHASLPALEPLSALAQRLPDEFEVEDHGGMSKADAFLALRRSDATTWFTNEVLTNNADYPASLPFKLLFQMTGSGPGLNVNTLALRLVGGKKRQVHEYLRGKLESVAPTRMIPTHGSVLQDNDLAARLAEVLARRL